ncbi:hypothetical protein [Pseudomonas sp. SST3]|uniref:hypothetical protein n=1 Tax=Pseudomonas sp. SST3 TaxID=2267882 RepID=UPI001F5108B9|nr:hypothetical protein [Pseudomonas sp. SST3]
MVSVLVEAVGAIDFSDLRQTHNADVVLGTPPAIAPLAPEKGPGLAWYQNQLPDWLTKASVADQNFFARHLKDLAALHNQNAGRSYLDDVPSIEAYALKVIKAQMIKDHPASANVPLDKNPPDGEKPGHLGHLRGAGSVRNHLFERGRTGLAKPDCAADRQSICRDR